MNENKDNDISPEHDEIEKALEDLEEIKAELREVEELQEETKKSLAEARKAVS